MGNIKDEMVVMTLCKCPKCGRMHKMRLFWTGNGMPRVYCHDCRFHSNLCEHDYEEGHKIPVGYAG